MKLFTHIGLERELFVTSRVVLADGEVIAEHYKNLYELGLPTDGNSYLLEARATKAPSALRAKHELLFAQEELAKRLQAKRTGWVLSFDTDAITLDSEERKVLRRQERKEPMRQFRIGGGIRLPRAGEVTAGLHVHFSDEITYRVKNFAEPGYHDQAVFGPLNIPRIVYLLDTAFKDVIADAGRQSGLYEMKPHGFEYRSLPTTVDLDRLVTVLDAIQRDETDGSRWRA